jgi:NAD(P)-dependent dehydrogenase (short-subunit alcohol dehydrogenase family)
MRDFAGRTAVVTGAASGIGRALAEQAARVGMAVVLADVEPEALARAAEEMAAAGHHVLAVRTDVSDAESVEELARRALEAFGAVHLVCNNAGVAPAARFRPVWEYPLEDWRWTLDVNLWGVIHGVRTFMPILLSQDAGHMINTASVAGLISGSSTPVYGVAKHGVVRLTEAVYASLKETGAPVGVSVLCPGVVRTNIILAERNRPDALKTGAEAPPADAAKIVEGIYPQALSPQAVADQVFEAIVEERFYVLTSDAYDEAIRERNDALLERRNPEFPDLRVLTRKDVGLS